METITNIGNTQYKTAHVCPNSPTSSPNILELQNKTFSNMLVQNF